MILQEIVHMIDLSLKAMNLTYKDIKVCELGDQRMKWHPAATGKKYLLDLGVQEHVSIDLNAKNGALPIDLSKPIDKWQGYFDITSNFGTAEHVLNGIYQCYGNIHSFTKVGGAMIHAGPPAGGCPQHSPYHYETFFFDKLAELCKYKLVYSSVIVTAGRNRRQPPIDRSLVCAVFIKTPESKFITEQEFKDIKGIQGL